MRSIGTLCARTVKSMLRTVHLFNDEVQMDINESLGIHKLQKAKSRDKR